jgi:hypothetical protein
MKVIDDWQSVIGISEIISALHRGEEIITMELQMNDSDSATLVVTRMFRVKDLQVLGQDEAEQQKSDPMERELGPKVMFNMYNNRSIQMADTPLSISQALGNTTCSQTYHPLQDHADDSKSGIKTRCEGCEVDIVGGAYYSNDNGTYGFGDLCIEKENSAQDFRVIRSCTRCNELCGAPAIQHVERCRLSNYGDTEEGGQYHCAPCCVSIGCTCPQQPETFGSSFYRKYKQPPGSINDESVPSQYII